MSTNPEMNQTFLPIEQRYVASCYPLPDRPGIEACLDWRGHFAQAANQNQKQLVVSVAQLVEPFPHLARLILAGAFKKMSIQEYFEGLRFPEQASGFSYHNPNLYLFATSTARRKPPNHVLRPVLDHINGCSVKPARISTSTVANYLNESVNPIDLSFLNHDPNPSDYVLVHGFNHSGHHQAIRYITPKEYQHYQSWFTARQRSRHNPFRFG
jgi:hypothetical protein